MEEFSEGDIKRDEILLYLVLRWTHTHTHITPLPHPHSITLVIDVRRFRVLRD